MTLVRSTGACAAPSARALPLRRSEKNVVALLIGNFVPGCELGKGVFSHCIKLKKVVLEEGITDLPRFCFDASEITEIQFPTTLQVVGQLALSSLWQLPEIILPEGVERIEEAAFYNNEFTKVFSLPSTVNFIGGAAFLSCSSTESIYCQALTPPECGVIDNGFTPFETNSTSSSTSIPATAVLYVPVGTAELYRAAPGWSYFQNIEETDQFPQAGLEQPAVVAPAEADGPVYNLQGMRVTNPQRGQLYIIGGRKVVY